MTGLANAVLPMIRTRADLHRWSAANAHGRQMHEAVDLLEEAIPHDRRGHVDCTEWVTESVDGPLRDVTLDLPVVRLVSEHPSPHGLRELHALTPAPNKLAAILCRSPSLRWNHPAGNMEGRP